MGRQNLKTYFLVCLAAAGLICGLVNSQAHAYTDLDFEFERDGHLTLTPKLQYFEQLMLGTPHEHLSDLFYYYEANPLQFYQRTFWLNEYLILDSRGAERERWISALGKYITFGAYQIEVSALVENLTGVTELLNPFFEHALSSLESMSDSEPLTREQAIRAAQLASLLLRSYEDFLEIRGVVEFVLSQPACSESRSCLNFIYGNYYPRRHPSQPITPRQSAINQVLEHRVRNLVLTISRGGDLNPLELRVARGVGL